MRLSITNITLFLFLGLSASGQHSLELKKSVVFQQEPIDYYLQVDSAYFNTPHYVLWVDPVENTIIDFNIHIPFAPVSKGSFYIEEDWKIFGEFILIALPKAAPNSIAYVHVDILPNKAELLDEWKKLSASNRNSWEKVNHAEGDITFQFGPKHSQPATIESSKLSAKLFEGNWEISIEKSESARNFTLQFSQKDSVLFAANSTSEQQSVMIPAKRLPPGELNITLLSDGEELDLLTIQNPLIAISESDINFLHINNTLGQFEITQLINPWVDLNDISLKVSITDFPELLMNESFAGEIPFSSHEFEENTIAILHSHKKGKQEGNQKIVVFNREAELYYNSDKEGNYFFDQYDYALLDDDYHIVSHDNFQGNINVNLNFPDIEKIQDQLPELLSQIPTRISIQSNKKSYDFSLESIGVLLDEVSISAKRKRATLYDTREKPNSVHYRNTDYICQLGVLNCSIHVPFAGHNAKRQPIQFSNRKVSERSDSLRSTPLHLWVRESGSMIMKYRQSHNVVSKWMPYRNTFEQSIASKARIRNIQEHYFKDEAIFGFYSDMISQAYAPLSLLYTSEIELPKVYASAYFIVELIHQPTGMRQQVVKKIE
ncbi:hypothetical protein ACFCT7_07285 [Fulvivirgaceae bacterium LMO-SS25]